MFKRPPRLLALDTAHGFGAKWFYEGKDDFVRPQFFSNGARILGAEEYGELTTVLDAETGREEYEVRGSPVISADGRWSASSGDRGAFVARATPWRKGIRTPGGTKIETANQELFSSVCAISPDNRTLVVQVTEFTRSRLDFYDMQSGKRTQSWPDFPNRIFGKTIQWSRNGQYLLSTWYFPDGQAGSRVWWSLWRMGDGRKLASAALPDNTADCNFEVEVDGRVLSYRRNSQVLLSQPTTEASISKPCIDVPGETVTAATLSLDRSYVVAGTRSGRVYRQRVK